MFISDNIFLFVNDCISLHLKKQSIIVQITKKPQYIASSLCIRELLWLRNFCISPENILPLENKDLIITVSIGKNKKCCDANA